MKSTAKSNGINRVGHQGKNPVSSTAVPDRVAKSAQKAANPRPAKGKHSGVAGAKTTAKSTTKTPVQTAVAGDRHAVLERNLERFPWSRLSDDRGDQAQLQLLLDEAGIDGRSWRVTSEDQRLPGPFDADVYIALATLFNSQVPKDQRPDVRTVHTSIGELAGVMRRERGGTTYQSVRDALLRLKRTEIHAVRTFREGELVAEERVFNVLGEVRFGYRRDGQKDGTAVTVEFPATIAESIARGNFRLLDVGQYFALGTPTARRLYRYLDYRRWKGAERQDAFAIPLRQLAEELPIDRDAPAHIKRTLDPAHADLVRTGVLASAEYEERPVKGKQRGVWWVTYRFAVDTPQLAASVTEVPAPPRPAWDPRAESDYLTEMVGQILAVLQDPHSSAFYVKCAKTFEPDALLNILGGVRQAIAEGMTLELARKTFTATAKKRAPAMGLQL